MNKRGINQNARRATRGARRILVTAGPTREYLDPVRYLSNDSSGRMGFALAKAAQHLGLKVTLVAGPVDLKTPANVHRIDVTCARCMRREVLSLAPKADVIVMAAAVADYQTQTEIILKRSVVQAGTAKECPLFSTGCMASASEF